MPDFPLPVGSELVEGLEATYEENEMLDRWQAEADERGVRTLRVSFEEMVADKPSRARAGNIAARFSAPPPRRGGAAAALRCIASDPPADGGGEIRPDRRRTLRNITRFVLGNHTGWCDAGNFSYEEEDEVQTRLHGHPLSDNVTNWKDVVAALEGKKFEKYLTMDGSTL